MNVLLRNLVASALALLAGFWLCSSAAAQVYCGPVVTARPVYSAYRTVCQTVYEQQPVTTYRLHYETVFEERQVTTRKPVWETETRVRRVTVAKPVLETSTRVERYKVLKPVLETETRVQRQMVRRPVTETVLQDRSYLTCEPVTTMRTQYVDQGGFVDQMVYRPGVTRNRLQWLPGSFQCDPLTGSTTWYRGGFHWVPQQAPGVYQVQRQYVPNVVACQVPQTTYVQKHVTEKVPVTVTRYVDECVETPVQVQVQKWVEQVVERPITVTTQRIQYETQEQHYNVQVCKWVNETRAVRVPHTVAKWVAYSSTRLVPRTVTYRVPVDPCGGCGTVAVPSVAPAPAQLAPPAADTAPGAASPADTRPSLKPPVDNGDLQPVPDPQSGAEPPAAGDDQTGVTTRRAT